MESDELYRWEKRREKKSRRYKSFHLDILDWVMLALICFMFFISLRVSFIFETVSAPCVEILMTAGQSSGYPPIFELAFVISLLMGGFWLCVTAGRILAKHKHWSLIAWHIIMFLSIIFLALMNWNLTSSSYVKPPDGIMVVENIVPVMSDIGVRWQSPEAIHWVEYQDGQWYASGSQACIWLDENKVSYNDQFDPKNVPITTLQLLSKGPMIEALKDTQLYRPMSDYERDVFLDIKACQKDITRYGKHASECLSETLYPVSQDRIPPPHIRKIWGLD